MRRDAESTAPDPWQADLARQEHAARQRAERIAARTARLQVITAALSRAAIPSEVTAVVMEQGVLAMGAGWAMVGLVDATGEFIEVLGERGFDPPLEPRWRRLPLSAQTPMSDSARLATPIWIESAAEFRERYAAIVPSLPAVPPALSVTPLVAGERVIGALSLIFGEARLLGDDDRDFILTVAGLCAQALERARLFEAEKAARSRIEHTSRRSARLHAVTEALSHAVTVGQVGDAVVREGAQALGARSGALWLLTADGAHLEMHGAVGYPDDGREFARIPLAVEAPITMAVREHRAVLLESRADYAARFPNSEARHRDLSEFPLLAVACMPLIVDRRTLGALAFAFNDDRRFDVDERAFLEALARHCAQGIDRANLYDAERRARAEAERAQRRLAFLANASRELASSLDYAETLNHIARLAVPSLSDYCVLDLVRDGGGELERVALAHTDPEKERLALDHSRSFPDHSAPHVLASGQPILVPECTDEMRVAAAGSDDELALLRRLGVRSYMAVPVRAGDRIVGVLAFSNAESPHRFDTEDLALAEELARRSGSAIENARLYRAVKTSEEQAQRAFAEAREADRRKDDFLAMLGHELRNPLAPIVTALQIMRLRSSAGGDDRRTSHERDVIERQVRHLVRLVDDLLDVSRVTRGKIELKKSVVELATVVAKAIEMASPLLEQRAHHLAVSVPAAGLLVEADPARLAQVLSNLLTNAAKYTEPGGHISLSAARAGTDLIVRVRDDGIGIAEDMLPRVFDLFVQEKQAIDRAQGGLGLGLAIVRSLVQLHGGSVRVHSDGVGRGSEFVVRIPALLALDSGRQVAGPSGAHLPVAGQSTGSGRDPLRILVVDDNGDAADLLAQVLEDFGHATRVAHDGPAALIAAREFRPSLALLDIGLPVMDGYELGRRLRELPGLASIRLIALTGYGQESDLRRSRAAGFADHLVKPIDLARLAEVIARLDRATASG